MYLKRQSKSGMFRYFAMYIFVSNKLIISKILYRINFIIYMKKLDV